MATDDKDFKVVDKRFSKAEKKEADKSGDGFVMKEGPKNETAGGEVDFSTFVLSLATGAFIQMGLAPDPLTKKTQKNIELAKQNIDILALIQEKTKGNLTVDEQGLLDNLLTEARLRFVEASR